MNELYIKQNSQTNSETTTMKKQYLILSMVLTIAFTLPMFGQHIHETMTTTVTTKHSMSINMGKPTFSATVEGLHMKVYLMTQDKHQKMMKGKMGQMMDDDKELKGMIHDETEKDKATKEAMMAGTHHIMLDVTDAVSKKEIANASAKVLIVSPSKKETSVDLISKMSHFGTGLTLDEKGEYQLTMNVTVDGVSKTAKFPYLVK